MKFSIISIIVAIATFALWLSFAFLLNPILRFFLGLGIGLTCGVTLASSLRDIKERKERNAYYKSLIERMHKEHADATEK